jgi:hypothetical protein
MVNLIPCQLACLGIAVLYYTWRDAYHSRIVHRRLHERVAYMLWVAASRG